LKRVCQELGLTATLQKTFGGSDNNSLAKHGIHGIVIANAMFQCHSCEEFTTIEELAKITELTYSLMKVD
jgi:tripeptide aminopeptidase